MLFKEYIAENLCEKKDEPESCCEGKCFMEKQVKQITEIIRSNGLNVRPVSCTVGGLPQNEVNPESSICNVSCNPIGQARQLNHENVDLVVMIGLCLGHDILFQREVKADCTTLVVKDRVYDHAPLNELKNIHP